MAMSFKKTLTGCGIGCLIGSVLIILSLTGTIVFMRKGGISKARIIRFIAVRSSLQSYCNNFMIYLDDYSYMNKMDEIEEAPSAGEFLRGVGKVLLSTASMIRQLNSYLAQRNEILLANQMGHGENTWLYVMIYHAWLNHPPVPFMLHKEDEIDMVTDRVLVDVWAMVERRATAAGASSSIDAPNFWQTEFALATPNSNRIPFGDNFPPGLGVVLEPFRTELESLYCPATSELDLTRTEREGLSFEHK